ncbi:hypothetical protein DFH11DRAFT_1587550 [Phellopilus nigrolimitatus]|nr:hypothetical protein DFH11DRAFT_1587550 [Phellopilus nigrolimitatus]
MYVCTWPVFVLSHHLPPVVPCTPACSSQLRAACLLLLLTYLPTYQARRACANVLVLLHVLKSESPRPCVSVVVASPSPFLHLLC